MPINVINGDEQLKSIVREWLEERGLKLTGPGIMRDGEGKRVALSHVKKDWKLAKLANYGQQFADSFRETAIEKVLIEDLEKMLMKTLEGVSYDSKLEADGTAQLLGWLRGATGQTDPETLNLYAAVMKHYIWQIKRKAKRLPVTYHVAPLLVGGQGTGKTTAINRLNAPLAAFTVKGRPLDEITDPRNYNTLSENLIVFLDEMGRAKTTCIDHLKTIITADSIDYRPMRTNDIERVEQSCTFIGASNKDIKAVISDTTGMRRFFQLSCTVQAATPESHALVNAADVTTIWQAVDETRAVPYIADIKEALTQHQEDLRTQSTIEEYLACYDGAPGEFKVIASKLYDDYAEFCKKNNLYPLTGPIFFRELAQNFSFRKVRTSKCMVYLTNEALGHRLTGSLLNIVEKRI